MEKFLVHVEGHGKNTTKITGQSRSSTDSLKGMAKSSTALNARPVPSRLTTSLKMQLRRPSEKTKHRCISSAA